MSATSSFGRRASRGLGKNDIRPLAPARAPAARPQIEPPGSAPPDSAAAPSNGVAAPVGGSVKMTSGPWLLLARRPPGRRSSRQGDRAAGERGGPELRGRRASRGLAKNDIRALAPARAPAARPQIEPPGSGPPASAAAPSYGVAAPVGGSLKMTLGPWLLLARRPPGRRSSRRGAGRRRARRPRATGSPRQSGAR